MSRYTVVWDKEIEYRFIDQWTKADSQTRAILTEVANWVDSNLANSPETKGQAESDDVRILFVPISFARITVAYEIYSDDRIVNVIRLNFRPLS